MRVTRRVVRWAVPGFAALCALSLGAWIASTLISVWYVIDEPRMRVSDGRIEVFPHERNPAGGRSEASGWYAQRIGADEGWTNERFGLVVPHARLSLRLSGIEFWGTGPFWLVFLLAFSATLFAYAASYLRTRRAFGLLLLSFLEVFVGGLWALSGRTGPYLRIVRPDFLVRVVDGCIEAEWGNFDVYRSWYPSGPVGPPERAVVVGLSGRGCDEDNYSVRANGLRWPGETTRGPRNAVRGVIVPLWLVMAGIGCAAGWLLWRGRGRFEAGHCGWCGYDLTKNESGICPECGVRLERSEGTGKPVETG